MDHIFQVDLRGLIELLSGHLYSGPAVFVRELLQNGVDAIAARRRVEPAHAGAIRIELIRAKEGPATLLMQDDGIGLTEEEIHTFLATIGQSSKRGAMVDRPDDFLGQFGIGLLSCFMVTDEIVVITRSAREGSPAVEWRGRASGTYSVRTLSHECAPGTQVYLQAKAEAAELFEAETLLRLVREYGEFLPPAISFTAEGATTHVNQPPPWDANCNDADERESLLAYGRNLFQREILDVVPLESKQGDARGLAFVLAEPVHPGAIQSHRVYLKNMLLSPAARDVLPEWAFFVQCIINVRGLRPTASRESFYEDANLELAREQLGDCLRRYLFRLAREDSGRLQQLIAIHHLAVKSLAVEDDECLRLFADWLPFETSLGDMTLGEFRRENPVIRFVPSRDQFRQIAHVAASQSLAVINAGYVYDVEILERIGAVLDGMQVARFDVDELADQFQELSLDERQATFEFERLADAALQRYKCGAEIRKFRPVDLPALFVANRDVGFSRFVEQSQEAADPVWSDALSGFAGQATSIARLHLNYSNSLVRRIAGVADRQLQASCVEMLYVQALLLGHVPLKRNEINLLNDGLLNLIGRAIDAEGGPR